MQRNVSGSIIVGTDIHGFHSMEDLDMVSVLEESKARWLRPNEIYAILCNYNYFDVQVRPVNLPPSGSLVLFDRKKFRNFRKDGYNWKKKNDGKTVKEAHEHLKVGNEERIHVYYAHGEDNPTFVRRCYWLLDKSLEHIVLVHYRETREGSAATPVNSNSSSGLSAPSPTWPLPEGVDFVVDQACYTSPRKEVSDSNRTTNIRDHELTLHQINTLEWDELLVLEDSKKPIKPLEGGYSFGRSYPHEVNGHIVDCGSISDNKLPAESYVENFTNQISASNPGNIKVSLNAYIQNAAGEMNSNSQNKNSPVFSVALDGLMENVIQDRLQTEDDFEPWMNDSKSDPFVSTDAAIMESSISETNQYSISSTTNEHHLHSVPEHAFCITDVSPSWAVSTEETKILIVGRICERQSELMKFNLFCVCGDVRIPVQVLQPGVFRCVVPPQTPATVNLFLSLDGHTPLSQIVSFEFRAPRLDVNSVYFEDNSSWQAIQLQMRLAKLLFSTTRSISILSSKVSQDNLKKAKNFFRRISNIENSWADLSKVIEANQISFPQAKNKLFELVLQKRMYEWLLERVMEGSKTCERDPQGQGVIHLCAMLDYLWAVYPFSWSGLSLDYRDKFGWTALHWAAYYGREKMVAKLLSAGAKASLVTDPTPESIGGYTAADLASKSGHEGLAAYLAEKALVQHFQEMTLAGNVSGYLQPVTTHTVESGNFLEEELCLKDTLAAYRTAADAAARIQTAFRQRSLKIRTRAVESSNPEAEARKMIAAMKIQHAFRKYDTGKKMVAAARIQHGFHGWKIRKDFLNKRRQAIKIQAAFRGFQARKHYSKIIWSVGVLEKAILRWRLKRKGIRGIQVTPYEEKEESDVEEDFFKVSRQQAEDRVERSVVRVQALFRSKRAQEEYRRMKLAFSNATVEYDWTT